MRAQIAEDVAARYSRLVAHLLDIAEAKTKQAWATCAHCNRRTPIEVYDAAAQIRAAELLFA